MTARSDLQAIAYARRIYRCGIGNHYEIWRDKVLVHTELQDSRLALRSLT